MNDDDKPTVPPKPKVVGYGFACGGGRPCRVLNVIENEPELEKLPAPAQDPKS